MSGTQHADVSARCVYYMGIPLWILLLMSRIINSWPSLDQQAMAPCHTAWLGSPWLHLSRALHHQIDKSGYWAMSFKSGKNSYPAFCKDFWDLGREAFSLKRRAECRVVDRVGFTPFHLDIWVPLLSCWCWCFGLCFLLVFVLAIKVPGSFYEFLQVLFNTKSHFDRQCLELDRQQRNFFFWNPMLRAWSAMAQKNRLVLTPSETCAVIGAYPAF